MDARSNSSAIDISISIEDITCPVTQELFFEPVLAMPCGHAFEEKASGGLVKDACPTCRKEILMFGPALATKRELDKALQANPELYSKVYFDLDHFAEIVSKKNFKHPVAERFIKLLENAQNHINDKAVDGAQKNKNAIQVLCASFEGRELLRSNAKIQSLISDETKELKIDGKTIAEWLAMEKEEKPVAKEKKKKRRHKDQPSNHGIFANNAARPARQAEDNVWQKTVDGKENAAKALLEANPDDIFTKRNITEHTLREVNNASPFQIALRCGDVEMAEIIKRIALDNFADGQARLDAEYQEVFPNGYEAHVTEQCSNTFNFNNIVNAISDARPEDLTAALEKRNNRSALCQALDQFRDDFDEKSLGEEVFNPNHLLKAMEIYNAKFSSWNWNQRDLFWRQVIGYTQRYLPSCYKQAFCQGLYNLTDKSPKDPFVRKETLEDLYGHQVVFDTLSSSQNSGLGFDFAIYSYCAGVAPVSLVAGGYLHCRFSKLMSDKNSKLGRIMRPEQNHRASPGCLIM